MSDVDMSFYENTKRMMKSIIGLIDLEYRGPDDEKSVEDEVRASFHKINDLVLEKNELNKELLQTKAGRLSNDQYKRYLKLQYEIDLEFQILDGNWSVPDEPRPENEMLYYDKAETKEWGYLYTDETLAHYQSIWDLQKKRGDIGAFAGSLYADDIVELGKAIRCANNALSDMENEIERRKKNDPQWELNYDEKVIKEKEAKEINKKFGDEVFARGCEHVSDQYNYEQYGGCCKIA